MSWRCHSILQNALWCAISKQGLTGLIFVKDTIANQSYLQQLQNGLILVIQQAGHVDKAFSQQDGACLYTVNVTMDMMCLSGSHNLSSALGVGGPSHHVQQI